MSLLREIRRIFIETEGCLVFVLLSWWLLCVHCPSYRTVKLVFNLTNGNSLQFLHGCMKCCTRDAAGTPHRCGRPVPPLASCSQHALPRDWAHVLHVGDHKGPGQWFQYQDVYKYELIGEFRTAAFMSTQSCVLFCAVWDEFPAFKTTYTSPNSLWYQTPASKVIWVNPWLQYFLYFFVGVPGSDIITWHEKQVWTSCSCKKVCMCQKAQE